MPGSGSGSGKSIARLFDRHKSVLGQEMDPTHSQVLHHLVKRGVLSLDEQRSLVAERNYAARGELFVDLFAKKGFNAFREFCVTLELECPHLLTSLLLESTDSVAETLGVNHSRENSMASVIYNMSPKCNNRELEMHRSPSANSVLSNGGYGAVAAPLDPNSTSTMKLKDKAQLENVHELLEEPVEELGGERIAWEYHNVVLDRVPGYGFGIAVSGGRDNPHFTNGDPSIAISDVLKAGPAEGKLLINDRVISANGISLEGVDYATAVQVLRDSGQTVSLVVKRRVVLPPSAQVSGMSNGLSASPEPKTVRVSLSRNKKKEDFGVVLGCKIYIKEITARTVADKDGSLEEGDLIATINGTNIEGLSLKEARSLIEKSKDKLDLVVRRSGEKVSNGMSGILHSNTNGDIPGKHNYAPQNLFVQPASSAVDVKNNLTRAIYSSNPLTPATEPSQDMSTPPRPPLPQDEDHPSLISTTPSTVRVEIDQDAADNRLSLNNNQVVQLNHSDYSTGFISGQPNDDSLTDRPKSNYPDPRYISFQKNGSVGIRLTGGNEVGIFVTAVQPGSPAAQQGLQPGDKILKVNDMDMKGVTREEAVLFLLSLQDQINLIAQYRREEYDQIVSLQRGDSFYIKAHFNYEEPEKGELSFKKSEVFHVVDTLHNGVVGSWQVFRMDPISAALGRGAEQIQKGVVPNKARGEELATQQFNAAKKEKNSLEQSRGTSFFRRKRDKSAHHRRSKSLGKDHWEDLVWSESMSKFPAYERVSLRHPGFPRPVVIFGPCADIARERLLRDYPGKFAAPQLDINDSSTSGSKNSSSGTSGIVRLSSIREVMNRGKHALLDVTPNAVDKLNYAQFYPIVILAKADSKQTIKDIRAGLPKKAHLSSKKLLEQCQKLEKLWSHVFTTTLNLNNITSENQWYTRLTDLIDKQQIAPIWMSESKPDQSFSDDFLFPMTSRLSYASSPESDGEFCDPDPIHKTTSRNPSLSRDSSGLARSTSDPNLAHDVNDASGSLIPDYNAPPPYAINPALNPSALQPSSIDVPDGGKRRSHGGDSKYGFSISSRKSSNDIYSNAPMSGESLEEMQNKSSHSATNNEVGTPNTSTSSNAFHTGGSTSSSKRSLSQPPKGLSPSKVVGEPPALPNVPPKIDRLKKPSRRSGSGSNDAYVQSNGNKVNSLERHSHLRDLKMSAYDPYDPYSNGNDMPGVDPLANGPSAGHRPRSIGGPNSFYEVPGGNPSPRARQHRAASQDAGYRSATRPPGHGHPPPPSALSGSNGYEASASATKYSSPPGVGVVGTDARYRYTDYKPVPPPKTSVYKPVPPPKPKSYHPAAPSSGGANGTPRGGQQPPPPPPPSSLSQPNSYLSEANYMNSGQVQAAANGGYAPSLHYHSTQMNYDGPPSNYGPPPSMSSVGRGYDDDSGQGSSLDRDYPQANGYADRNGGYGATAKPHPPPSSNPSRGQYYYNVPPGPPPKGPSPRRGGDGLDLSNREYRGSAFELYKKPMTEARNLPQTSQHYYNQHQLGR